MPEPTSFTIRNPDGFKNVAVIEWPRQDNSACEPFYSTPNSVLGYLRHEVEKGRHMGHYLAQQSSLYTPGTPLIYIADGGIAIGAGVADGLKEANLSAPLFPSLPEKDAQGKEVHTLSQEATTAIRSAGRVVLCDDVLFWGNALRKVLDALPKDSGSLHVAACVGRMNHKFLDRSAKPYETTARLFPDLTLHYVTPQLYAGKDNLKTSAQIASLTQGMMRPEVTAFAQRLVDMLQKPENKRGR